MIYLKTFFLPLGFFLLSCTNNSLAPQSSTKGEAGVIPVCKTPQKIKVYREWVYDLSGYEGVAGGSSFGLFDENDFVDPKGNNDYHPMTSPQPKYAAGMYFARNRGNRIVVDLQKGFKLSEIYLFDKSRQSDSVWVYTGKLGDWKLKGAFLTKGDVTQWAWKKITIDDSTRFVMFRFNSWEADISEAVLYGCAYGGLPAPPIQQYTGPRLPAKTLKELLGINAYHWTQAQWMKPFYNARLYTELKNIDTDTINEFPHIKYNTAVHGWFDGGLNDYLLFPDSLVRFNQGRAWYAVMGVPKWMEKRGLWNFDRPVTQIGMDAEDPMSYKRHANMFWNLAAAVGSTKVDTALIQSYNNPRFSGRNIINVFENGNEVDATWNGDAKYCSPMEYFAESSADYDGHEGRLGDRMGIKRADPNAELINSGFFTLDTNRLRVLDFISRNLRTDQQFIWKGGIQYHHYSTNGKGVLPGDVFSSATAGASPEEDSLRYRLKLVRDFSYRIQPKVECILGEWGYDKSRKSKMATPLVPGYNARQSQGIMLLRGINAVAFSGFDRLIIYWIRDDNGDDQPNYFLSAGVVGAINAGDQRPYESWFYIATLINRMGDYVPEQIISEKGSVWVYKYHHRSDPSLKAYFVYCPTHNGAHVDDYVLKTGKGAAATATEISLLDNSTTGATSEKPVTAGGIHLKVTEAPRLILVQER